MKKLIWPGLGIVALSGCAGTTYVHESWYDDYDYPRYPGREVYVHRETWHEPRPRVIVVRPPAPQHRHFDERHIEERHPYRHDERRDTRRDGPPPGDRRMSQPPREGDQRVVCDPRRDGQAPVSADKPRRDHRDHRKQREEEREDRPR